MKARIVYDTETTGLFTLQMHRPLTVGFILLYPDGTRKSLGEVAIWGDNFVVTEEAMKVNRIDLEQHKKAALPVKEAVEEIKRILVLPEVREACGRKPVLMGHNEQFDRGMMEALFNDVGDNFLKYVHYRAQDTQNIFQFMQENDLLPPTNDERVKKEWCGLKVALDVFGIEASEDKLHGALFDADCTAQLYTAMCRQVTKPWYERLGDWFRDHNIW